jgi:glycosyltransferase involved in cell wall biosynthesis
LKEIKIKAPKNVTVIGWADAATFWSALDCAISTSDNEGMPVALIEAQLAGVPVIATDVGSNAEVITNNVTGFVTSKKADDIILAIKKILNNNELMASMGEAAEKRAKVQFNPEKMIDTHTEVYAKLMNC